MLADAASRPLVHVVVLAVLREAASLQSVASFHAIDHTIGRSTAQRSPLTSASASVVLVFVLSAAVLVID